ncbi:MAG: NAD(P)-binding domain-containing protein [Flavobacteriaceae bacterium]
MELGIIGLGVMGKSLAVNAAQKGISVIAFNRDHPEEVKVLREFIKRYEDLNIQLYSDWNEFFKAFQDSPRIISMLPAGPIVDEVLESIASLKPKGTIFCDGGNSFYKDSNRRAKLYENYLGIGISGGERGALLGPAMMVGGEFDSYQKMKPILDLLKGNSFAPYLGPEGSGHFVKMVHNGLEYGQMQLLVEIFEILGSRTALNNFLRKGLELHPEIDSFLVRTALEVSSFKEDEVFILDEILDVAGSKGTGAWTAQTALEFGVNYSIAQAAVNARITSSCKAQRMALHQDRPSGTAFEDLDLLYELYKRATRINHQQALVLIRTVSEDLGWNIDLKKVVKSWSKGSIVASEFLQELLGQDLEDGLWAWKQPRNNVSYHKLIEFAALNHKYIPCFTASWTYETGMQQGESSAHLIQGLRDAFGAHTYEKRTAPRGVFFHTKWPAI